MSASAHHFSLRPRIMPVKDCGYRDRRSAFAWKIFRSAHSKICSKDFSGW